MAVIDDPRTVGRAHLSFADEKDIDEFVKVLGEYERGEISPEAWRRFRLVRGTYGQRQPDGIQMLRVKIPQGIINAEQLETLAEIGERFSRGFCHITTRQNVQFHFVALHDVETAQRMLAARGITTREACGNSVRNITACPYAGVAVDEVFDVTPYADATTRYFLRHPLSSSLPRKFKIAFEGCGENHAVTPINDIGFRAVERLEGGHVKRAFRVTVAGSTSILCTTGYVLFEALPANEILEVAEAVIRVYKRLGDYEHRQRNRMKFLIRAIGWDAWRAEFEKTLAEVRQERRIPLPFDPEAPPVHQAPNWPPAPAPGLTHIAALAASSKTTGPGLHPGQVQIRVLPETYARWADTNVRPQAQPGFHIATVRLPLGDITSGQMRAIAALSQAYGDGTIRVTVQQNLVLRWVPEIHLRALWAGLQAVGLGAPDADTVADVISCPGAESCRLAVTHSRSLGRVLSEFLAERPDLIAAADGADIKISGCPNGCGQHHIATIGFQGSVRRLGDKAVPQYFVLIGGAVGETKASFGRVVAKVPARRMTEVVDRLITLYRDTHVGQETASEFFQRLSLEEAKLALGDLERMTLPTALPVDFVDLDQDVEFKPEVMDGECSA
jgi:sulfite reductase (NADPH) hemoprotein beta-component